MTATETRWTLINNWIAPKQEEESQAKESRVDRDSLGEEHYTIRTYYNSDYPIDDRGVAYQRCGGGKRIIRKSIGNS